MKKLLLLSSIIMIGCSAPEQPKDQIVKDCNCNTVVEVSTMNIINGGGQLGTTTMYHYITINECTGVQRESGWSTSYVEKGQCK